MKMINLEVVFTKIKYEYWIIPTLEYFYIRALAYRQAGSWLK
jgi:hypothetical protein